jgi:hypothetical protein
VGQPVLAAEREARPRSSDPAIYVLKMFCIQKKSKRSKLKIYDQKDRKQLFSPSSTLRSVLEVLQCRIEVIVVVIEAADAVQLRTM